MYIHVDRKTSSKKSEAKQIIIVYEAIFRQAMCEIKRIAVSFAIAFMLIRHLQMTTIKRNNS